MTSVTAAASGGTRRDMLEAMRDRIAIAVDADSTPARDLAALTRRLMDIAKELEAMDVEEAEDSEDAPTPDAEFDASSI